MYQYPMKKIAEEMGGTFQIEIDMNNAAFEDAGAEVARILKGLISKIENGDFNQRLKDINGNNVGFARWNP